MDLIYQSGHQDCSRHFLPVWREYANASTMNLRYFIANTSTHMIFTGRKRSARCVLGERTCDLPTRWSTNQCLNFGKSAIIDIAVDSARDDVKDCRLSISSNSRPVYTSSSTDSANFALKILSMMHCLSYMTTVICQRPRSTVNYRPTSNYLSSSSDRLLSSSRL